MTAPNLFTISFKLAWERITYLGGANPDNEGRGDITDGEIRVLDDSVVLDYCGSDWPPPTGILSTLAAYVFWPLLCIA